MVGGAGVSDLAEVSVLISRTVFSKIKWNFSPFWGVQRRGSDTDH